jgi:alanine dehydrogenase
VCGKWLKDGCHVDLVGSFTADMRETDDEAIRRSRVFFDSRGCLDRVGDLVKPLQSGAITSSDLKADLYELCSRRHRGRESRSEITLFKNGGGGHLDLFVARYLWECVTGSIRPA